MANSSDSTSLTGRIPRHVSIIMDGNGRWATIRGRQRWEGHVAGVESVRAALAFAVDKGIEYLSLYAFSEENWNRGSEEVDALMALMMKSMLGEIDGMSREGVRFIVLGNRARLSPQINATIDSCMERTANNSRINFIIFISYSGKWDILQAARKIAAEAVADPGLPERLTAEDFSSRLVTAGIPDPDLIIRTSGEERISNYLLWQAAYSEFYFSPVLWPDFRAEEFSKALEVFSKRDRRYGKTK